MNQKFVAVVLLGAAVAVLGAGCTGTVSVSSSQPSLTTSPLTPPGTAAPSASPTPSPSSIPEPVAGSRNADVDHAAAIPVGVAVTVADALTLAGTERPTERGTDAHATDGTDHRGAVRGDGSPCPPVLRSRIAIDRSGESSPGDPEVRATNSSPSQHAPTGSKRGGTRRRRISPRSSKSYRPVPWNPVASTTGAYSQSSGRGGRPARLRSSPVRPASSTRRARLRRVVVY